MACGKFYKVDSLAVATRISHYYQVLLDDGNRIIIPQGNFKFFFQLVPWNYPNIGALTVVYWVKSIFGDQGGRLLSDL